MLRKSDLVCVVNLLSSGTAGERHDYGDPSFPRLIASDGGVRVKERIIACWYSSTQLPFHSHLIAATITRTCTMFPPDFIWKKNEKKLREMNKENN